MVKFTLKFVLIFLLVISCAAPKRLKLKELYDKYHAELNGDNNIDTTSKPSLEMTTKKDKKEEERLKKQKRNVFYGYKTVRAYVRRGKDPKKREYEIFFVLKKPVVEPNPYIANIYWYNRKKRTLNVGKIDPADKKYARILHGPYYKRVGKNLMEEGIYYVGSKHGRWVKYDKNFLLTDKRRFYKGWPTDAEISYYDTEQKKPKEVIPIQFGKKDGEYFSYTSTGELILFGIYKENVKIGVWVEYYDGKKKKREIQYAKDPFVEGFEPYIIKEYNEKGKVTYDFRKAASKADSATINNNFKF